MSGYRHDTSTTYDKDDIIKYSLQFERSKTEVKTQKKLLLNTVKSVLWPAISTISSGLITAGFITMVPYRTQLTFGIECRAHS